MPTNFSTTLAASALIGLGLAATPAIAEEGLYYGIGLGYTHAEGGFAFDPDETELDAIVLGGTLGYRWESPSVFYGAELDVDLGLGQEFEDTNTGRTCAEGASSPYFCTHNATARLRGIVGTQAGNYEVFGSLGFVSVFGTAATAPTNASSATNTGYTFGLGMQGDIAGNFGRVELIYDNAEDSDFGSNPVYEAVTLKATWMF